MSSADNILSACIDAIMHTPGDSGIKYGLLRHIQQDAPIDDDGHAADKFAEAFAYFAQGEKATSGQILSLLYQRGGRTTAGQLRTDLSEWRRAYFEGALSALEHRELITVTPILTKNGKQKGRTVAFADI
ncbi:hypothetical protein [Nocardia sp. NPDC020380]|uniref:hypothetical protein n=1 Tax=Nocardia sp. NPDC020380 TaxID=3364309 RepID=UPI0037A31F35